MAWQAVTATLLNGCREALIRKPLTLNGSRTHHHYLKEKEYYATDGVAGELALAHIPRCRQMVSQNGRILCHTLRHLLAEAGVRQFIDTPASTPGQGNAHEVVRVLHRKREEHGL